MPGDVPAGWTRNGLKSHLGATYQSLHRLRQEMLGAAQPGRPLAGLASVMGRIAGVLNAEAVWLRSLDPVPVSLRSSSRANFMAEYARYVSAAAAALADGLTQGESFEPDKFAPFGEALLVILATEGQMRDRVR